MGSQELTVCCRLGYDKISQLALPAVFKPEQLVAVGGELHEGGERCSCLGIVNGTRR